MKSAFTGRFLTGWISEFINRPLTGGWPQIPLDDATLADFDGYLSLCQQANYTDIIIWGLFVDRNWPLDIVSCVDADRKRRIQYLVDAAHQRGIRVYTGLGLYSWGFEEILRAYPHLNRGNARAMCPSLPESQEWMRRVLDFTLSVADFDGIDLQSADQGRCPCAECATYSDMEYHTHINRETASYVRTRRPNLRLIMDNWGLPFANPADIAGIAALSGQMDYLIDHDNSSAATGRENRRALIQAVACPYGTLAGHSVWPPQHWPRDRWFLPTILTNVEYLRDLYADGARAAVQFVTTQANPSGEITLRFTGKLLANIDADPERLLEDVVDEMYQPINGAARTALAHLVADAEQAYFENSKRTAPVGLFFVDEGFLSDSDPGEETYLRDMSPEGRAAYALALSDITERFTALRSQLQQTDKANYTLQCFQNVLHDIEKWQKSDRIVE